MSKSPARLSGLLVLAAAAFLLSGCISSILADRAITAPNQQHPPKVVRDAAYAARMDGLYTQAWRLPVGPPAAELSVAVLEPGDYHFNYRIELRQNASGRKYLSPQSDWAKPAAAAVVPVAKGTVLLLHGYMDSKESMHHWAVALAECGYRTVLVDFRGQGRSTGDVISFGQFECRDLAQLLDDLQKRGLFTDRIGVLGVSYGASMGLLLAAHDARVGAMVALEPFSSAETAVVEFAHGVAPSEAAKISADTFQAGVAKAARRGNFSWQEGDVLAAMKQVKVPVLFFHGAKDRWLSPDNSRRLLAAAPDGSRLTLLDGDDHVSLSMRLNPIATEVRVWLDEHLK